MATTKKQGKGKRRKTAEPSSETEPLLAETADTPRLAGTEGPEPEAPERAGWGIVRLTDIIPDGRPIEVDGQPYTLLHPGAMSLYMTAKLDKLRKRFWELFRKWDDDKASEKETEELDRVSVKLVPMVTDVPGDVAAAWRWQTRIKIIVLHFGFITEILPDLGPKLRAAGLPNRAARRRARRQTGASSSPSSATDTT